MENHDHRKLGQQLDLYHMQEEAPGMVFWHNNGIIILHELENFIRIKLQQYKYQEVKSPIMMDRFLWEKTGHWENYEKHMFSTVSENRVYCIKPMNCPGHIQIFNRTVRSYKDLPIRIAEFGSCHRNEFSGSLHGLMRVRSFTQDDAHIFCTKAQIREEVTNCIKMMYEVYSTFGFHEILVHLSTRPEKRIGNDKKWDEAEHNLLDILHEIGISFKLQKFEGAFYGPKIEFSLLDCLNRIWQCGTVQLDFTLPYRLKMFYINKNNEKITPIIIHRAILGSMERFVGILTEEFSGFYPTWLSPIQVVLISITSKQEKYILKIANKISKQNIRIKLDLRNEKIGFKIREHTLCRIPYMLICGNEEMITNKITIRTFRGKVLKNYDVDLFIKKILHEIKNFDIHQMEE